MERKDRKHPRLKAYDYRENGCYFVTICVRDHKPLLGCVVVRRAGCPHPAGQAAVEMRLSHEGEVTQYYIEQIPRVYREVLLDQYVVMPNHIHLLLLLEDGSPSISTIINQMKGAATKRIGRSVWQKLFHDHIVRDEHEFLEIWQYIATNPARWLDDCFYRAEEL